MRWRQNRTFIRRATLQFENGVDQSLLILASLNPKLVYDLFVHLGEHRAHLRNPGQVSADSNLLRIHAAVVISNFELRREIFFLFRLPLFLERHAVSVDLRLGVPL